jgi:hypothetical protein
MPTSEILRHWLNTPDDPLSALSLTLILLVSATLGAALASLVTWVEDYLIASREEDPSAISSPSPARARMVDRRQAPIAAWIAGPDRRLER